MSFGSTWRLVNFSGIGFCWPAPMCAESNTSAADGTRRFLSITPPQF
jgi:hypothetical protein